MDVVTDLDARYGRHRRQTPRWLWPVIATIGISIGVAWAAWASWSDVDPFQARVHSFEAIDEQAIKVDLEVFRDEPIALTCRVYAQAHDKAVVGEKSIEVPASSDPEVRIVEQIRTERRAVTVVLDSCQPQ